MNTANKFSVLLYYKYVDFPDCEKFRDEHYYFCSENDIKGRIFIANEGINGTVSGIQTAIEKYKNHLRSYKPFEDIIFKENKASEHVFKKLFVRIKNEIVTSDLNVSLKNTGRKLKPEELKEFYDSGKDFIIIDVRNDYESNIGKFRNAITPSLKTFRDWKQVAQTLKNYKDKPIITYCTGGIRCEKASAYLVENGFENVFQLDGGIVSYTKKFPDTYWEGSIFVFDERRLVEVNNTPESKHIGRCYFCNTPTSYYINCHNQDCDKLIISCHECKIKNDYCCSDECRKSNNKRKRYHG